MLVNHLFILVPDMAQICFMLVVLVAFAQVNAEECIFASQSGKAAIRIVYDTTVPDLKMYLVDQGDANPREVMLIDNLYTSSAIHIGKGSTEFIEYRGNFVVTDYTAEKISLPYFEVGYTSVTTGLSGKASDNICNWVVFRNIDTAGVIATVPGVIEVNITLAGNNAADAEAVSLVIGDRTAGYDRVWVRFTSTANETIYGGGQQFSQMNMKGRPFPIWTREQGVGRNKATNMTFLADTQDGGAGGDYHTTYWPEPLFYTDKLYSVVMTSSKYSVFDFSQDDFSEVEVWEDQEFQFDFHIGSSWQNIVTKTSNYLLGGMTRPRVPEWSYKSGAILGLQGGTEIVMELYDQAIRNNVKVSGIWIQDWVGQIKTSFGTRLFWDWKLDEERYPGIRELMTNMEKEGVYFTAYINPYLNYLGSLYAEASDKDYLVKVKNGDNHLSDFGEFYCGTVDFTNPQAFNWYKEVIKVNLIDVGFRGWMADFGEYMPIADQVFYDGRSPAELHNLWPSLWAQVNKEAIEERDMMGEIFVWMRAGHTASAKYVISGWAGDQNVDWSWDDGLVSTIPAALSLGMSGVGITHYDIGGFTSLYGVTRDQELLLRSAELAAFTPTMRTHEGNRPTENFQIYTDDYTMTRFGRLTRIHDMLGNYTESIIQEYYQTSTPAQRPMFFECPDNPNCYDEEIVKTQFMFGPDLLVAPKYQKGQDLKVVYLPAGKWTSLWTADEYDLTEGLTISVEYHMGEPPLFYRTDSIYASIFESIRVVKAMGYPPPVGAAALSSSSMAVILASIVLTLWCNNSL